MLLGLSFCVPNSLVTAPNLFTFEHVREFLVDTLRKRTYEVLSLHIMGHMETIRNVLVSKVFNCFLHRHDVTFHLTVLLEGFFSSSRSWVPIVDVEPLLFGQAIGNLGARSGLPHLLASVSCPVPHERRDSHCSN